MEIKLEEALIHEILAVVMEIPYGSVATYGQIARLINRPKNARLVGKVLSLGDPYGDYPCHRVVNYAGRLAPGFPQQKDLLLAEGIEFNQENHVIMSQYQWEVEK